ncbi:hypothetical protein ICM_05799 [Bacillus cereus BAG1X2-3]|uniref:Uncharacterized protein n=1 Tax=Bacillus cereus TaxID=1396 RepID=A0A9X7E5B4_BACCE|nr:DUF6445 family protein [Bacillus cereus]EOO24239.1 hypothetical protein ICC_05467 [Bacillus cereus BAG1X1-1]EOO43413.1 hypothetical protein ICI_05759 [Bacillus cereus BAG1X2-1]EOO44770.1 hypothetical protein ICK_05945 [Bacillus cereus BAG1X2-2]EOO56181.1 hypothetical protein ICM_05799 [Bacillus cereus BAG1X2-3]EOP00745.1 hypothetical protein ICO_06050 [Bacillus cereus BAG2O-1]
MLPEDILIVDNFYSNPDAVRKLALEINYQEFGEMQNFPGFESEKSFSSTSIKERFQKLIKNEIIISPREYIFGKFRYSTENDYAHTEVHLDHDVDWTGIVYLTKDEDCQGGLSIYHHKKLGLDSAPVQSELQDFNCKNIAEFDSKYIYPYTKLAENWNLLYYIPIKFNRLILFRGSKYFHGITEQFGNSIYNSRLTQNFFFKEKVKKGVGL